MVEISNEKAINPAAQTNAELRNLNEKMDGLLQKADLMLAELRAIHQNTNRIPVSGMGSSYKR
jgi:hypothetical protein